LKPAALIKKSKQLKIARSVLPYEQVQSVLLIWDASQSRTDIEELKVFGHELRKSGKNITFLSFHPIKKLSPDMQPNELHKLCCKADFNFFGVPKSKTLKDLLNQPFDLLINGCLTENDFLKTIATYTKAKFRIGPFLDQNDTNFYEISIKPNGANPCENYLIETGRYLRKII
jgi:hypothetical protein